MNNFTKDELGLLLLSYWASPYCIEPDKDLFLKKLQSMIDNYQEPKDIHFKEIDWSKATITDARNVGI